MKELTPEIFLKEAYELFNLLWGEDGLFPQTLNEFLEELGRPDLQITGFLLAKGYSKKDIQTFALTLLDNTYSTEYLENILNGLLQENQ